MWLDYSASIFGLAFILHAFLSRLYPRGNRVLQFVGCAGIGVVSLIFWLDGSPHIGRLGWMATIATYGFFCELYIFVFTLVTSSVSVSLLLGGSPADLTPAEEMVIKRVRRMLGAGILAEENGRLRLSGRGRALVWIFGAMRSAFHGATHSR
jgi:hypothetical protein